MMVDNATIPDWLPDWQDESQYPDPETTEPKQWAWEFLRRNVAYQKDYKLLLDMFEKLTKGKDPEVYANEYKRIRNNYGLVQLPTDPMHKNMLTATPWLKLPESHDDASAFAENVTLNCFFGFRTAVSVNSDMAKLTGIENPFLKLLKDTEKPDTLFEEYEKLPFFSLRFSLAMPVEPQIKAARKTLAEFQKWFGYKPVNKKIHLDKLPFYLRVLDAKVHGIGDYEIAQILYPKMSNEDPDYLASDTVKQDYRAAKRYRDRDFIFIDPYTP